MIFTFFLCFNTQIGPRFRLAENVWATEGEAIVHLNEKTVQDNLIRSEVEAFGYSVHPGILDAITQCLAGTFQLCCFFCLFFFFLV